MITEHDLQEAIAECKGIRNPNANTCIKLAAFLIIQKEMYGDEPQYRPPTYSYSPGPMVNNVDYTSETEFGEAIHGKDQQDMWATMDELMTALRVVNPRLYTSAMDKIRL